MINFNKQNLPFFKPKKNTTNSLKGLLALFMMVMGMGVSWGQTNPTAFALSGGSFTFTSQTATNTAYPTNIQGWNNGGTNNLATLSTAASTADITARSASFVRFCKLRSQADVE